MSAHRGLLALVIAALSAACQPAAPSISAADHAALRASVDTFAARVRRADWPGNAALFTA